jgi:hypothetical protein
MTELVVLRRLCPGLSAQHTHEPWGAEKRKNKWAFRTDEEAEYPPDLCKAIASAAAAAAHRLGHLRFRLDYQPQISEAPEVKKQRIAGSVQPRGTSVPQIVPEFLCIESVPVPASALSSVTVGSLAPKSLINRPAKVLRLVEGGKEGSVAMAVLGIYRTPDEFAEAACSAKHPFDSISSVPDILRENIYFILVSGKLAVAKHRLEEVRKFALSVKSMESEDAKLFESMDSETKAVLKGKKLASLDRLLREGAYIDSKVALQNVSGFDLTGTPERSGIFKQHASLPSLTPESLKSSSSWVLEMPVTPLKASLSK